MGLARIWRVVRTGFAFVFFGAECLAITFLICPWNRWRVADPEARELRTQRAIHQLQRAFIGLMVHSGLMRYRFEGADRIAPGSLLIANHPTLIDAPAVLCQLPQLDCVTKDAHTRNPFMRGVLAGAGYIPNSGGKAVVEEAVAKLGRGRSLLMFPEGTRSPEGGLGPFHRGAAHVALASGIDPLPILITCDPPTLMRGQAWYDVPDRRWDYTLRVGDPLSIAPYREALAAGEPRSRVARRLDAELREYFEKSLREQAV